MSQLLAALLRAQLGWGHRLGEALQPPITAVFHRATAIRSFLNGTWLGHPLHPALTDVPVGAFVVTFILDLAGQRTGADVALTIGVLGMAAAALSGLADYADTYGETRDATTVHATLMAASLILYLVSLGLRLAGPADRTLPIALSIVGLALVLAGAFVGGDLVFRLGNVVDRHAWAEEPEGETLWQALDVTELPEGVPTKAMAGDEPIVLVRWGESVLGLHAVCAHAGGPLDEGKVVDGDIQCPWHGSRFRMSDGRVTGGPAVFDQPRYEVRRTARGYEARRL